MTKINISNVSGVLLAAGSSTRFGSNKLCHQLADGTPMVLASVRKFQQALASVLVIIDPRDTETRAILENDQTDFACCERSGDGMGATLAYGVQQIAQSQACVVGLADMPYLQFTTIKQVAAALHSGAALAAPFYQGRRGHPVGFGTDYFEELSDLSGDEGGKAILTANKARIHRVDVDDPGCLIDIDTPQDVLRDA